MALFGKPPRYPECNRGLLAVMWYEITAQ